MALFIFESFSSFGMKIGKFMKSRCNSITYSKNFSNDSKPNQIKNLINSSKVTPDMKNNSKVTKKSKASNIVPWQEHSLYNPVNQFWDERRAIKKVKKNNSFFRRINCMTSLLKEVQDLKDVPKRFSEIPYYIRKKKLRVQLLEQQYLPQRKAVLKADLAAAHFIINRGGKVKFVGHNSWTGRQEASKVLPFLYIPGYNIEAIDAEGTDLCREGLENLIQLRHLTYVSFKGVQDINDWCMDYISREFNLLQHLDISDCKNVTHRGLSCFYRFERLKTLKVQGVSDSPEFKVACLMLQEIMPDLEIIGIDLTIPKKIDPVNEEQLLINEKKESIEKVG